MSPDNETNHSRPSDFQFEIAAKLGIDISGDSRNVAAARIREQVEPAIKPGRDVLAATDNQIVFGRDLRLSLENETIIVASARIQDELDRRNQEALEQLQLRPGDRVVKVEHYRVEGETHQWEKEYVVSSVGANLRVYFKGGNGYSAWPTQLRKLC